MAITVTEIVYPKSRMEWRRWLKEYFDKKEVIWVRLFKKSAGKYSLPYDDMVEECLCFGWIDGVVKKLDAESRVQRITRKRPTVPVLNRG